MLTGRKGTCNAWGHQHHLDHELLYAAPIWGQVANGLQREGGLLGERSSVLLRGPLVTTRSCSRL